MRTLFDLAHSRAGDKGETTTLSVIPYDPADYELLLRELTAEAVARHLKNIVQGQVIRYELPGLPALNFVCHRTRVGGVTTSLRLDTHGKSLSSVLLEFPLP